MKPQIVKEDVDLVALVREHKANVGLKNEDIEWDAGIEEAYGAKMEGPLRTYGRRPTKLGRPVTVAFERENGRMAMSGVVSAHGGWNIKPKYLLSAPASYWIQAMGLSVVLMDRQDALELCERPIPHETLQRRTKGGKRVRRLNLELEISDIGVEPSPFSKFAPDKLRSLANKMASALASCKSASIAKVMGECRKNGIDPESLSMAVQLTQERALKMSVQMSRVGAYLDCLKSEDVRVSVLDVLEFIKDDPRPDDVLLVTNQGAESL